MLSYTNNAEGLVSFPHKHLHDTKDRKVVERTELSLSVGKQKLASPTKICPPLSNRAVSILQGICLELELSTIIPLGTLHVVENRT